MQDQQNINFDYEVPITEVDTLFFLLIPVIESRDPFLTW